MNCVLYDTKYLQLKAVKRNNMADWVYAHRPNAKNVVIIVPVIEGKYTLFLKTKRPPLIEENRCKFSLEFPAGLVGDLNPDETTEDALKKELMEETGLRADKIEIKTNCLASSGGLTSETATLAIAYINDTKEYQTPVSDGGVIIERIKVPLNEVKEFIQKLPQDDIALCAQTLAGLYYIFVQ